MKKTYHGSCHCGDLRYRVQLDLAAGSRRCNCRFCLKTHFWKAFVMPPDLELLHGADGRSDYRGPDSQWPEGHVHHWFCRRCGVRCFTDGFLTEFGGHFHCINLCTLDDASDQELAATPIQYEDGRCDAHDRVPAITSFL
jgi:hypothetical protein